jgi:riboflavin synthase
MFTGIITNVGHVVALTKHGDAMFKISTDYDIRSVQMGASIACSGVCLTVMDSGISQGKDWFMVQVSDETLSKSTLKNWKIGQAVNLERALKVGDELGGHMVTGHVDSVAKILGYERLKA